MAKIRRFTIIARRSIANIVNVPGRVGRSLDDECLAIAIIRRGKFASLLNLDRLSEELSSRTNAKSLTSLVITEDTSDANDYNSDVNDLSVAEKSMRMLNVTAEDVMDARARIQERSYWKQDANTPETVEKIVVQFPSKRDKEGTINPSGNKQRTRDYLEKGVDHALRKEDIMEYSSVKKEEEKNYKVIPVDEKKQNLIRNQEDTLLVESNDVTSESRHKVNNHAESTESRDTYVTSKKKRKEVKEEVAKMVQCPSFQTARNMEAKPCASLVKKLEAKFCPVPVNQEKRIDQVDQRKLQINTQLTPTGSDASKKDCYENSKITCACHRANSSKNGRHARAIDIDGKNVEYDININGNGEEFRFSTPIVNMQRSKFDKSAFKYSEAYRLRKQIQKWEESRGKSSWESKSLAHTVRPSGYAKNIIDASDKVSLIKCRKSIQTETRDESTMMSDSLSERYRLKRDQMQNKRSVLRSVYNVAPFREKNYAEAYETKMKALGTCNNFLFKNKEERKTRKRDELLPANRKLSIEEREEIELKALRAYNELTLSEDKKQLEVRKKHDTSLNYGQLTKKSEVSEMAVLKTYNNPILSENKQEIERTREYNLSSSFQRSVDERGASRVRNELTQSGSERELHTERKRNLSRNETPSECEDVETPTRVSNHLSIDSYYKSIVTPMRRNVNCSLGLHNRCARQANMSLNLREITRNIECTVHPRGIVLTNKNLHGQFLENGRFRESQQRDIVDDNTASTLHSAFFFKPEIITRMFQRAQTRIGESFPNFPTFRREDFNTEFICRMSNEMVVCNQDSSIDFERMMGNDRNIPGDSVLSDTNDNRGIGGERGHDLCIMFIGREQIPCESETVIIDPMTGSQENARSNVESTQTTNILIFNEDYSRTDSTTNGNLPAQLITGVLRNFDIEMSREGSIRDVTSPTEEHVSNVNVYNNPQSRESNTDNVNLGAENNSKCDKTSLHNNANIDNTIHEIKQLLHSSNNCPDNINVTSYANSLGKLNNLRDGKYLSTNNNNNEQCDTLDNKTEKSMSNYVFKNSSELCIAGPSSFIESNNDHVLRSCNEELQKMIQLSNSAATLNNQRKETISNLKITNCNTLPQFRNIETLKLETTIQNSARNKNENREVSEETNKFLAEKLFQMHSDDNLQQDDSFYFTYERNDDPGTPVSLENGSLMEDFLNEPISSFNSSYS